MKNGDTSTSMDYAMIGSLELFQSTNSPLHNNTYLDADSLSSFVYPYTLNFPYLKTMDIFLVLLRYLELFYIAIQY